MTLKEIGEFGLINKLSHGCLIRKENIVRAIGDDAAAFTIDPGEVTLVTTDMLIEEVHFKRDATSGFNLGHKALAVNLSDIAAMGGTARECFVSIGIPDSCNQEYIEDLYKGIKTLAGEFGINILGGDTTFSRHDLIINICVLGIAKKDKILFRNTARVGDIVFSTGFLGDSRAGLHLILNNEGKGSHKFQSLIDAHILPRPQLGEGRFLSIQNGIHAAIDVSDGLGSDVSHIASQSDKGVRLEASKIPISQNLELFCRQFDYTPYEYALSGGEDYTLLCTVLPDKADEVAQNFQKEFKRPLFPIGKITKSKNMELVCQDGKIKTITPEGWNHFRDAK